jgi:hypothetical protein
MMNFAHIWLHFSAGEESWETVCLTEGWVTREENANSGLHIKFIYAVAEATAGALRAVQTWKS